MESSWWCLTFWGLLCSYFPILDRMHLDFQSTTLMAWLCKPIMPMFGDLLVRFYRKKSYNFYEETLIFFLFIFRWVWTWNSCSDEFAMHEFDRSIHFQTRKCNKNSFSNLRIQKKIFHHIIGWRWHVWIQNLCTTWWNMWFNNFPILQKPFMSQFKCKICIWLIKILSKL